MVDRRRGGGGGCGGGGSHRSAMANLELTVQNCQAQLIAVEKPNAAKKAAAAAAAAKEAEDSRRDEWSTEAINSLLDVYEAKWNHRNRGNLKGGDWEDVAMRVSTRGGGGKSTKSPFQCKNKVASMKQKYRSETLLQGLNGGATAASGSGSSRWPFFARMDIMLRVPRAENTNSNAAPPGGGCITGFRPLQAVDLGAESEQEDLRINGGPLLSNGGAQHNKPPESHSNGNDNDNAILILHNGDDDCEGDDASNTLPPPPPPPQQLKASGGGGAADSDDTSKYATAAGKPNAKHRKHLSREVAASIRSFADSILKLERAKMEMFKDSERLRAEMEARRVDMELKRTEIIMNTQLEIAKLLSGKTKKKKLKKKPKITESLEIVPSNHNGGHGNGSAPPPPLNCGNRQIFGDYISNGGASNAQQHQQHQQCSSSLMVQPPHFVPTAIPVPVVQSIPHALQFMPSPVSQPKPS